ADHKVIRLFDDLLEPETKGPAEQSVEEAAFGADSGMIMDVLRRAVCRSRLDERADRDLFAAIKLGDVGVGACAFPVPGAVDEDNDPLHAVAHAPTGRPSPDWLQSPSIP